MSSPSSRTAPGGSRETDLADCAPALDLADPLAELLGALAAGETFHYDYRDAVKLAGHSCPAVAGAYLMTVVALRHLYGDKVPVRGEIGVTMGGAADDGSTGPMSQVIGFLTGAAPETGFGGLMGRFKRRGLMRFDPSLAGRVQFRRLDTGALVEILYDPDGVPSPGEMGRALATALSARATDAERARFGELWQGRVRAILASPQSVLRVMTS